MIMLPRHLSSLIHHGYVYAMALQKRGKIIFEGFDLYVFGVNNEKLMYPCKYLKEFKTPALTD